MSQPLCKVVVVLWCGNVTVCWLGGGCGGCGCSGGCVAVVVVVALRL